MQPPFLTSWSQSPQKNSLLVLFLWLYCTQCLLSQACVTRLESHMVLQRMFPLLFWKILTVSTSLWDHCQYTPGYSKMNLCNASVNAPYICFECVKRFVCAVTSSSYGPVSDAPCEVSPVLNVCRTLFLLLLKCDVSDHATVNPETQLMPW